MWNWRNISAGEEEVKDGTFSLVLKRVEICGSSSEAVVLHELVCGGLDEEGSNQLKETNMIQNKLFKIFLRLFSKHFFFKLYFIIVKKFGKQCNLY